LVVVPGSRVVYAVREDHTSSDIDCVNTLVRLALDGDNANGGTVPGVRRRFLLAARRGR